MSQVGQYAGEEEKEEGDHRCNAVDDEGHSAAASPFWWRVKVNENGGTSCT